MELPECELRPNGPKSNYEPSDRSVNASVTCMWHSKNTFATAAEEELTMTEPPNSITPPLPNSGTPEVTHTGIALFAMPTYIVTQ